MTEAEATIANFVYGIFAMLFGGWALMILLGILHVHLAVIPPLGYLVCAIVALLLRGLHMLITYNFYHRVK